MACADFLEVKRHQSRKVQIVPVLAYRAPDFAERLANACPDGIDVYFGNVGGAVWEAVLPLLNDFSRVPVYGLVAKYNATALPTGQTACPK